MKSSMANQPVGIVNRLFSSWNLFRRYQQGIFGNAESEIIFHNKLCDIIRSHIGIDVEKARILDLGCGQLAKQTALFASAGAHVTGIDMEIPTYKMGVSDFLEILRKNGFERAVKSLIRHLLFDKAYFKQISLRLNKKIAYSDLDVRIISATDLKLPENCFDFIFSKSVFEHIDDVPRAVQEVNRVLKDSGIARISIHLFPSLSGGHHLEWMFPDSSPSDNVPPWDHLLDNKYPVNTYLNKMRLDEYRKLFHDNMIVLKDETREQGRQSLTPELLDLLSSKGYTRKDLLTTSVIFLCQKKLI